MILAGGRGTRFWPLSRRKRAKQLLALDGKLTMIQQTVKRLNPLASADHFWIITNEDSHREIVRQLPKLAKIRACSFRRALSRAPHRLPRLMNRAPFRVGGYNVVFQPSKDGKVKTPAARFLRMDLQAR